MLKTNVNALLFIFNKMKSISLKTLTRVVT